MRKRKKTVVKPTVTMVADCEEIGVLFSYTAKIMGNENGIIVIIKI